MNITFLDQYSYLGGGQIILISLIRSIEKKNRINVIFPKGGNLEKKINNLSYKNLYLYDINESDLNYKKKNIFSIFKIIKNNIFIFCKYYHVVKSSDLLYCNAPRLFVFCIFASIFLKKKINYHIHIRFNFFESNLLSILSKLKNTNKIIFCSNFVFDNFKSHLIPLNYKKVTIIENGLSEEFDNEKFKNRFFLKKYKNRLKFAIVGSLKPEKGQDIVLLISKKFPNIDFYLIGKESENNQIWINSLKSKRNKNMFFISETLYLKKLVDKNLINIFLVPSKWQEPFGLVAIEGMSLSCLTIVSKKGGLIDIAKRTGAFSYVDEKELIKIIEYLDSCNHKKLKKIAKDQFLNTKNIYSFNGFSEKIRKIIKV